MDAMTDVTDAIRRTYDEYFKVFQTLRPEAVASYYHVPSMALSPQGVTVMTTSEEVRALFRTMRTALQARDYARSERGDLQVTLLSDQTALVSTSVVRYATDGTQIERFGVTYILRQAPPLTLAPSVQRAIELLPLTTLERAEVLEQNVAGIGWKIAVVTIHDANAV
jgi:hypothetical protein